MPFKEGVKGILFLTFVMVNRVAKTGHRQCRAVSVRHAGVYFSGPIWKFIYDSLFLPLLFLQSEATMSERPPRIQTCSYKVNEA